MKEKKELLKHIHELIYLCNKGEFGWENREFKTFNNLVLKYDYDKDIDIYCLYDIYKKQKDEIKQLKIEVSAEKEISFKNSEAIGVYYKKCEKLEADLKREQSCVDYYADTNHWDKNIGYRCLNYTDYNVILGEDLSSYNSNDEGYGGEKARKTQQQRVKEEE